MIGSQQRSARARHVIEPLGADAEVAAVHKAAERPYQLDQLGVHAEGIGSVLAAPAPLDQARDLVDLVLQHHADPAPEIRVEVVAADILADDRRHAAKLRGRHRRQIFANEPQEIGHEIARRCQRVGPIADLDLKLLHCRNRIGARIPGDLDRHVVGRADRLFCCCTAWQYNRCAGQRADLAGQRSMHAAVALALQRPIPAAAAALGGCLAARLWERIARQIRWYHAILIGHAAPHQAYITRFSRTQRSSPSRSSSDWLTAPSTRWPRSRQRTGGSS